MAELRDAVKVGAMTLLLGGALYFGYRFVSRTAGVGDGYGVWAYIPDVTGVAPNSRVMISGVQVGVVDKIWLDEGKARVDIRMRPDFPLFDDAAVGKRAASFIGEYYIVLTPGTTGKEQIPDGGQVKYLLEDATLQSLQEQARDILSDVKAVTKSLAGSVGSDKGEKQIAEILANIADVTAQLAEAVKDSRGDVRDALRNVASITAQSQPELLAILKNVREATEDVKQLLSGKDGADGKSGELRSTIERVNRASDSLESLLEHADNVAERIDKGEGTVGRLTKDETLINEVESVVENVSDFVGGLSRLQTIVGLRTDYNFLANSIKSYVELRLQPQEDYYYMVQIVDDPRGNTKFEQVDVDTTNPAYPPHYRETRVTTTNDFRVSVQFAKRIGPFTGRFGILESTGGIGLDVHLLDDRFELRQDLFGFGEQLEPRWRIALSYEFLKKLWLLGGVDNILSGDRRDYFFGLQLRFNDTDLKSVLPFAPGP
ncbi:MAG: MCE family protein [Myxococcales bacterium]|nr:MCE family protein [Myxococcales bacterium]